MCIAHPPCLTLTQRAAPADVAALPKGAYRVRYTSFATHYDVLQQWAQTHLGGAAALPPLPPPVWCGKTSRDVVAQRREVFDHILAMLASSDDCLRLALSDKFLGKYLQ